MTIDLPKIGKPATNALHHIGVKTLEDIAGYDRTTLLAIHGVGPKAMDIFAFVAGFPILGKSIVILSTPSF
jgi:hypothetical protein